MLSIWSGSCLIEGGGKVVQGALYDSISGESGDALAATTYRHETIATGVIAMTTAMTGNRNYLIN